VTLNSVNRVNWFRAKARYQRWKEEVLILEHEMVWTELWFGYQKQKWEDWMKTSGSEAKAGHYAYAAKQVGIWSQFVEAARKEFGGIVTNIQ
jgi:hypothetical protein